MMKNVIFDLGKVLIDYDFTIFLKQVGCEDEEFSDLTPVVREFESGLLTRHRFYSNLKKRFNHTLPQKEFESAWSSIFWEIPEMIEFAKNISKNHNVFILSNTDELHFPFIWENFPSLHFFGDNLMLSYKLKSAKPDQEIYRKALDEFDLTASNCIFIDDKLENVEAARSFGITAIHHIDQIKTRKALPKKIEEIS